MKKFMQEWFGKYYLGLPLAIGILYWIYTLIVN